MWHYWKISCLLFFAIAWFLTQSSYAPLGYILGFFSVFLYLECYKEEIIAGVYRKIRGE
jgi:hypothetical protein